jgi:PPOX class probable F420-dependent enzyme
MPSRRDVVAMTQDELADFLEEGRTLVVATVGRDGRPHLTALWYVMRGEEPWIFTYARSQKVKNLERVPLATLMVESGTEYAELRGATIYADAELVRDPAEVGNVAEELFARYEGRAARGTDGIPPETRAAVRERAAKRVAVRFRPTRVISWDHAKLGGTY